VEKEREKWEKWRKCFRVRVQVEVGEYGMDE
jgi:hypothetical protein